MWNRRVIKPLIVILSVMAISFVLQGCHKEKYKGAQSPGNGSIETPNGDWFQPKNQSYTTMKAKATLQLSIAGPISVKANVNVEVGRQLMISMQPLFGVELYRVTCTQDSIIFIDKLTRSYIAQPYSYFTDKNFNLNYDMIEGLLCNRYFDPLKENYKNLSVLANGTDSVFHCQAPNYYVEFSTNKTLNRTLFSTNDGAEYVMADYNTFRTTDGVSFPMYAICSLSSRKLNFTANIKFDTVTFNTPVTIVNNIPDSYSKSSVEALIK